MYLELIGLIVTLLLIKFWSMKPLYWARKGIPYNLPLPFLGSAYGPAVEGFNDYWTRMYNRFSKLGPFSGFHNFDKLSLLITNTEILKEIVLKSDCFTSRGLYSCSEYDLFAKNIFFAKGDYWKRMRTKMSPYLSPARLKSTTNQMSVNIDGYSKEFEKAAVSKEPINVNETSLRLAVDVVVNTVFGISSDSFSNPDSFFYKLQEELFGHNFILRILLGAFSPFIYKLLRVTALPLKTSIKLIAFIREAIEQRKKNIGVRPDFVQGMLEQVQKDSQSFNEDDAVAQLMGMYMGGTETTGNSISLLLHELSINQDMQDKVRTEINKELAARGGKFHYDMLNQLPYTNSVINECLRKYPIVPVMTRECTKATTIGGLDIEIGTGIIIPIMAIHWDPEYYPEPEKFDPERFAEGTSKDNSIFMPFGMGPRTCVGWKMALIEITYAVCELLPKYRLVPSQRTKEKIKFNWKPTLNPAGGVWLNVEKI